MLCCNKIKLLVLVILVLGTLCLPANLLAAMSSTDYYIYADTVDTGGIFSTGGDYTLDSSAGESSPVGFSNDGTYEMRGGYQAMDRGYININIIVVLKIFDRSSGYLSVFAVNFTKIITFIF